MSNDSDSIRDKRSLAQETPSILSKNRTVIAIMAILFLIPLGTTTSFSPIRSLLFLITQIMIFGLLAMSFDLQLGRGALLNFGHVALFGVGAYVMAYTLNPNFLPAPFNIIGSVPFPFTLLFAMLVGGGLGLIMGLTTSRMRGTAFAFIALAIAMFIFNFFSENSAISGGETGLTVPTPDLIRFGPTYLLFVVIAFLVLTTFFGTVIFYIKKRTDYTGIILITPVMAAFIGITLILGTNILGPILIASGFIVMILLHLRERNNSISDPLQYSVGGGKSNDLLSKFILPLLIVVVVSMGLILSFATNISDMLLIWIEDSPSYFYTIPVQYHLVLSCLVMVYVVIRRIIASPFGRMITAVAQNEERAEALGYNSYHTKIVVLVISGAIASLAGALYASYIPVITPDTVLGVEVTINAMLYTIIGGLATLLGPLLGTGVVVYSELNLVDVIEGLGLPGRVWLIALGVMYIGIVLFMPLGIVGSIGRKVDSFKGKMRQMKVGRFEFGFKDSDYWIFGLLGTMGLILFLTEDARLLPLSLGIFGFLGAVGLLLMFIFRWEIWSSMKAFSRRLQLRIMTLVETMGNRFYLIFGLLGAMGLILILNENAFLFFLGFGILGILGAVGVVLVYAILQERAKLKGGKQ